MSFQTRRKKPNYTLSWFEDWRYSIQITLPMWLGNCSVLPPSDWSWYQLKQSPFFSSSPCKELSFTTQQQPLTTKKTGKSKTAPYFHLSSRLTISEYNFKDSPKGVKNKPERKKEWICMSQSGETSWGTIIKNPRRGCPDFKTELCGLNESTSTLFWQTRGVMATCLIEGHPLSVKPACYSVFGI